MYVRSGSSVGARGLDALSVERPDLPTESEMDGCKSAEDENDNDIALGVPTDLLLRSVLRMVANNSSSFVRLDALMTDSFPKEGIEVVEAVDNVGVARAATEPGVEEVAAQVIGVEADGMAEEIIGVEAD